MTPVLLRRLLTMVTPRECWSALQAGRLEALATSSLEGDRLRKVQLLAPRWRERARSVDPAQLLAVWRRQGLDVLLAGDEPFPARLALHPSGPWVLFVRGRPDTTPRPRVAVVGTRSSTSYGESIAAKLAAGLAERHGAVVTSLEPGIDAAARRGALRGGDGGLVAFAVGGADVDQGRGDEVGELVARGGTVVSEAAFGARAERWRFPRRNRLIAASSDVVVVVEAHATGGALHGAEAALALGIPVCAVPGSVSSPSSRGTNALLADGAHVVRDLDDVVAIVELTCAAHLSRPEVTTRVEPFAPGPPDGVDGAVLACLDEVVTPLEIVLARSRRDLPTVAASLGRLQRGGLVARVPGGYERRGDAHAWGASRLQP